MTQPTDDRAIEDALRRVRLGEADAFGPVVRRYERPVRSWLAVHSPPGIDADEVAQRTFVAAFTRIGDYRPGTCFSAWLFAIARSQLRTETTRLRRVADYHARYAPDLLRRELERRGGQPPDLWEARLGHLQACLDVLDEPLRRFLTWRYEEGIPLEEMASRCGRSVAAIKKQLWSLRQSLQRCIERTDGLGGSSPIMTDDERFVELWTDYLEGDLDEAGLAALRHCWRATPAGSSSRPTPIRPIACSGWPRRGSAPGRMNSSAGPSRACRPTATASPAA